jgi:DNA primase
VFASLPEGHDPDDLVRNGGSGAIADVLAGARPLADVLWSREIEAGRFDTPERRAGLEARINELAAAIGDEAVRRHYRQDLYRRLRELTAPAPRPPQARPGRARDRRREEPRLVPLSPRLPASSIVRGSRSVLPAREALILIAVFSHPWLLETEAEQLAGVEFLNGDADHLRRVVLDVTAEGQPTRETLRAAVAARDCGPILERIEAAVTHVADWPSREGAAAVDVRQWWTHVLTLHHRNRTLKKELKEAERALGEEPSDQNFARLQDVRGQLSALEGTEASIEGFGALSGRPMRGL